MTLHIGIILALLCAVATNVAFLLKHRGACQAPDVRWKSPVASAKALFGSRTFTCGMLVALGAWILHVGALALAPLSLVQALISGGLVVLAVLAERVFGFKVGRRQWIGVGLTAAGLVLLTATLPSHTGTHSSYSLPAMIAFQCGLLGFGVLLVLSPRVRPQRQHGLLLGAAAGILFGVSDVAIKALTGAVGDDGVLGLVSPWTAAALVASIVAFYASAAGFQRGDAVPVITLTTAAANTSAIAGGILVFGDPMPSDPLGVVVKVAAFALVIVAATLTPAPLRAAGAQPAPAPAA